MPCWGPDKQRVVKAFAQAGQHAAHSRLCEAEVLGSPCHTPLAKERIQSLEQVEIESSDITHGYDRYAFSLFALCLVVPIFP